MQLSVGTPHSLVTQLEGVVEESIQDYLAMWTSVGTPLSLVTQLGGMVGQSLHSPEAI